MYINEVGKLSVDVDLEWSKVGVVCRPIFTTGVDLNPKEAQKNDRFCKNADKISTACIL